MKKIALLICVMFSCTNEERAEKTLRAEGYTSIELTGYEWNECSDSDSTCTGFQAMSPAHMLVSGSVGCGREFGGCNTKGCTVRLQ